MALQWPEEILAFSLMLLIFPSYNLIRLETPVNQQGYKPTGVISRTILTDLESSQRSQRAENSGVMGSVELQEEAVPLAEDLAANPQHQPIDEGNRPGLTAEDEVPGDRRREDSQLRITAKNSSSGPQGGWSKPANPTPSRELPPGGPPTGRSPPGDTESAAKPGHADEM